PRVRPALRRRDVRHPDADLRSAPGRAARDRVRPVRVLTVEAFMRRASLAVPLLLALCRPAVVAAGSNRIYLVPAVKECPGPASCVPRQFESTYTFDTILLHQQAGKYSVPNKPSFIVDVRGVKDASGNLVDGTLSLRLQSGRVSLPTLGTFPDDSPL